MKKTKILAALAATMAVGATCAFAANPFADVPTDSWAYKSVVTLANSGILQGVDGTHFQGNRNITRYEAAEITAKAMAHADRANAQQRAIINKLANEFAGELNNLGVRVANLEDQVGTVKFSGTFKVDYNHKAASTRDYDVANYKNVVAKTQGYAMQPANWQSGETVKENKDNKYTTGDTYGTLNRDAVAYIAAAKGDAVTGDHSYSYTAQLKATAKVSKNVKANIGFKYKGKFNDDHEANSAYAHVNVANVQAKVADQVSVLAGRHDLTLGQGYIYDDVVDGVEAQVAADKVSVQVGYAKLKEFSVKEQLPAKAIDSQFQDTQRAAIDMNGIKVSYVNAAAKLGDKVTAGAYYGHLILPNEVSAKISPANAQGQAETRKGIPNALKQGGSYNVYGAYVQAKLADQVKALASYDRLQARQTYTDNQQHEVTDTRHAASWYGKVTYGKADFATPKSWDVWVDYVNADAFDFADAEGTGNVSVGVNGNWRGGDLTSNVKSWGIGVDYTFAKNAKLQFKQSFASKVKKEDNAVVKTKLGEQTKAQLVFVF